MTLANGGNITFYHADPVTWSKVISGAGSFTKTGIGTLTLTAPQNYTGPTLISGGVLQLQGARRQQEPLTTEVSSTS